MSQTGEGNGDRWTDRREGGARSRWVDLLSGLYFLPFHCYFSPKSGRGSPGKTDPEGRHLPQRETKRTREECFLGAPSVTCVPSHLSPNQAGPPCVPRAHPGLPSSPPLPHHLGCPVPLLQAKLGWCQQLHLVSPTATLSCATSCRHCPTLGLSFLICEAKGLDELVRSILQC